MSWKRITIVLLAAVAAGVGYSVTTAQRAAAPATQPRTVTDDLMDWLGADAAQRKELRQHDAGFGDELAKLREELRTKRVALAAALDDPKSTKAQIEQGVQALLAARSTLELRVTKYLVEVRDHLSPQQQRRLMGVCAAGVREGCQGPPWARGGATQPGSRPGKGHMKGRR